MRNSNVELFKRAAESLNLKFESTPTEKNQSLYRISGNGKFFYGSSKTPGFYPNTSRWQATLTGNKELTQKALDGLGFKTIPSTFLLPAEHVTFSDFLSTAETQLKDFPLILKPNRGLNGRGIKYIADKHSLKISLKDCYKNDLAVILQPILSEPEYRILVVNKVVELVHSKDFRAVIGDGVSTISSLLSEIAETDKNPAFINLEYSLTNHTPNTVLDIGVKFRYHIVKNSSLRHNQSSNFEPELLDWTEDFCKKFSIATAGIDLFITGGDFTDPSNYTVIEINSNPGLSHYYSCDKKTEHPDRVSRKVLREYFGL